MSSSSATRFLMLLTATSSTPSSLRYPSLLRFTRHRHIPSSLSSFSNHYHHFLCPSLPCPLKLKSSPSHHLRQFHTHSHSSDCPSTTTTSFSSSSGFSHPWPEWSNFIHSLTAAGYFNVKHFDTPIDEFVSVGDFPEEFLRSCTASLAFARDKADVLGLLSRKDIEVVVENGLPFLFKNSEESVRMMRLFLQSGDNNVLNSDRAHTVDLVKFLLSYASSLVSSDKTNLRNRELVESSVRRLFSELAQFAYNYVQSNLSRSLQNQLPDRYGQTPRPRGPIIEMKRGDWICPRCSFMNFARNVKCLECDEARPKRQLTGGEWECPQCDFYNYARNMACLRCDCKRPGEVSLGTTSSRSDPGYGNGSYVNKEDVDSRLAANEEKAQRWFSKVSQMDSTSDMNSAIADEDFPEIMPLRKGVSRFVVSTRKSPLERRLANAQYQRNMEGDGTLDHNDLQSTGTTNSCDQTINHSSASVSNFGIPRGSNSSNVPFMPLPADMFAKKPENSKMEEKGESDVSFTSRHGEQTGGVSGSNEYGKSRESWQSSEMSTNQTSSDVKEREQAEKSERWFKRVAELHNVTDLASAIPDEDFPEIMPMRKGENRFVVSKKKDRSLTSPTYKRRMALEQANSTNFIPFVPFPPNYFATKDNQQPGKADTPSEGLGQASGSATLEKPSEKLDAARPGLPKAAHVQNMKNQQASSGSCYPSPGENWSEIKKGTAYGEPARGNSSQNVADSQPASQPASSGSWNSENYRNENVYGTPNQTGNSVQNFSNSQTNSRNSESNRDSCEVNTKENTNLSGTKCQPSEYQNVTDGWTGKSLEGSAVKEPDPLDMSEEAKAERWFRRVAQIKDISELSQIPDEDFPSIMPMRKGVNKFVVSKRKTPLERRLTSTQYRRNLPIVRSDPAKENDNN